MAFAIRVIPCQINTHKKDMTLTDFDKTNFTALKEEAPKNI